MSETSLVYKLPSFKSSNLKKKIFLHILIHKNNCYCCGQVKEKLILYFAPEGRAYSCPFVHRYVLPHFLVGSISLAVHKNQNPPLHSFQLTLVQHAHGEPLWGPCVHHRVSSIVNSIFKQLLQNHMVNCNQTLQKWSFGGTLPKLKKSNSVENSGCHGNQ